MFVLQKSLIKHSEMIWYWPYTVSTLQRQGNTCICTCIYYVLDYDVVLIQGVIFFNLVRSCSSEKRRWRKITKLNASEWARSSKCCLLQNQLTGFQFRYGCWRNSMLKPDMVPMKYIIVLDNGFPSDPEVGHVAC